MSMPFLSHSCKIKPLCEREREINIKNVFSCPNVSFIPEEISGYKNEEQISLFWLVIRLHLS